MIAKLNLKVTPSKLHKVNNKRIRLGFITNVVVVFCSRTERFLPCWCLNCTENRLTYQWTVLCPLQSFREQQLLSNVSYTKGCNYLCHRWIPFEDLEYSVCWVAEEGGGEGVRACCSVINKVTFNFSRAPPLAAFPAGVIIFSNSTLPCVVHVFYALVDVIISPLSRNWIGFVTELLYIYLYILFTIGASWLYNNNNNNKVFIWNVIFHTVQTPHENRTKGNLFSVFFHSICKIRLVNVWRVDVPRHWGGCLLWHLDNDIFTVKSYSLIAFVDCRVFSEVLIAIKCNWNFQVTVEEKWLRFALINFPHKSMQ